MKKLYDGIPENVEPLVILGDDNDYLVVYTIMTNEDTIEILERTIRILKEEDVQEAKLTKH
jgi:hypothetical protein